MKKIISLILIALSLAGCGAEAETLDDLSKAAHDGKGYAEMFNRRQASIDDHLERIEKQLEVLVDFVQKKEAANGAG